jgi:hypothetical protein
MTRYKRLGLEFITELVENYGSKDMEYLGKGIIKINHNGTKSKMRFYIKRDKECEVIEKNEKTKINIDRDLSKRESMFSYVDSFLYSRGLYLSSVRYREGGFFLSHVLKGDIYRGMDKK